MADDRAQARRQLEALTVAARNFAERARGAADRADVLARCVARIEAWRADPASVEDPAASLRALPDPPTARMLAAAYEQADDPWDEVTRRARRLAEEASRQTEAHRREAERTEAMRAEAEARLEEPDPGLGG